MTDPLSTAVLLTHIELLREQLAHTIAELARRDVELARQYRLHQDYTQKCEELTQARVLIEHCQGQLRDTNLVLERFRHASVERAP